MNQPVQRGAAQLVGAGGLQGGGGVESLAGGDGGGGVAGGAGGSGGGAQGVVHLQTGPAGGGLPGAVPEGQAVTGEALAEPVGQLPLARLVRAVEDQEQVVDPLLQVMAAPALQAGAGGVGGGDDAAARFGITTGEHGEARPGGFRRTDDLAQQDGAGR